MNPLAERIVDLFMPVEKESKCNFAEFCFMLAHFQPTNEETPDEMPNSGPVKSFPSPKPDFPKWGKFWVQPDKAVSKAKLVFHLFDSNKSGKISKGEILDVLRYMVGANIGAENLEAIAERCLVEVRFGSNAEPL